MALGQTASFNEFGFSSVNIKKTDFSPNQIIQLGYPPNRIDLITPPLGIDFETCFHAKERVVIDDIQINIIDLKNLIKAKKASNRARDLAEIEELSKTRETYYLESALQYRASVAGDGATPSTSAIRSLQRVYP